MYQQNKSDTYFINRIFLKLKDSLSRRNFLELLNYFIFTKNKNSQQLNPDY